jgi:hypothetical protein
MDLLTEDRGTILFIHRTALFERCLNDLRDRGGPASLAAKRVDRVICGLSNQETRPARERFGVTRKGECRISNCKKIALGSGYRLVCILRDSHLVLLYVGSHDDCFRWIEHNKGLEYEIEDLTKAVQLLCDRGSHAKHLPEDVIEERKFIEAYEAMLMSKIDDDVLCKVFPGLCKNKSLS